MRWVRMAICTSGEPVSFAFVALSLMSAPLRSVLSDIRVLSVG